MSDIYDLMNDQNCKGGDSLGMGTLEVNWLLTLMTWRLSVTKSHKCVW